MTQNALGASGAVDIGSVKKRDPGVEGNMNGPHGLVLVDLTPPKMRALVLRRAADRPTPQSQGTNVQITSTESPSPRPSAVLRVHRHSAKSMHANADRRNLIAQPRSNDRSRRPAELATRTTGDWVPGPTHASTTAL